MLICQVFTIDSTWLPTPCHLSKLFSVILLHSSPIVSVQHGRDFPSPAGFRSFKTNYSPSASFHVGFQIIFIVHIQFYVSGSQLTSMPSFAARRCRCTWSCSSSSWLGCQSRDRMRSMLRAYIVWEGITPW